MIRQNPQSGPMSTHVKSANPDQLRRRFQCLQRRLQDDLTNAKAAATEIQCLAKGELPQSEDSLSAVCLADTLRALIDVSYGIVLEMGRPIHFATNLAETPLANNGNQRSRAARPIHNPAGLQTPVPGVFPRKTGVAAAVPVLNVNRPDPLP